jgi:penicillin-binding protein 1A
MAEDQLPENPPSTPKQTRLVLHEPPRRGLFKRLLMVAGLLAVAGMVAGAIAVLVAYAIYSEGLPELPTVEEYRPPILTEMWTSDRVLAGELYDERRKVVPYERIPKKLVQAFIAAEDDRFFDHPGFDPVGMTRAAYTTYLKRTRVQGGSSLTQQAAKAVLVSVELSKITDEQVRAEVERMLGPKGMEDSEAVERAVFKAHAKLRAEAHARATEKKIRRKIRELILALRLEKALTKEQILFLYLNNVYLGHHSYGVQAAAENYYRKDVRDLTLGEAALLAGLPQAPSKYSPFRNPKFAKERREYVLRRMFEEGMITEEERKVASAEEVSVYPVEDVFRRFAPFFAEHVRRDLVRRYGNERVLKDGLKAYTSMDAERQRAAQVAMLDGLISVDKRQGFYGPVLKLNTEAERRAFEKKIADRLGDEQLTEGRYYVGYVERIEKEDNFAVVNVGSQRGKLPILGMRWARAPNPEKYYPHALVNRVDEALAAGDVIIVRAVSRKELENEAGWSDAERRFLKQLPAEGPFLRLEQEPRLQGAIVAVDPASGYVVAMIGGYDFDANEFNRAFQACRQPGSSYKPVVYSAAIELLEWQVNHVLVDSPVVFDDPDNQLRWKPENYGENFKGDVLLHTALVNSMNIPAVKTLHAVGVKPAVEWARGLGITTPINEDLSMALGGSCVRLHELVGVYATMNRGGTRFAPVYVRKVEDRFGRTLEDHTAFDDEFAAFEERVAAGYAGLFSKPERVMKPETAFLITSLMRDVVREGTGVAAQRLGKPAAGKTGTTNDSFDTWFMGFTKDLVTGVWLGYDRYESPLGRYETGGRASLPIWVDFMRAALAERPQPEFEAPPEADIVFARIDLDSGKLAAPDNRRAKDAPFVRGKEPTEAELGQGQVDPTEFMWHEAP